MSDIKMKTSWPLWPADCTVKGATKATKKHKGHDVISNSPVLLWLNGIHIQ